MRVIEYLEDVDLINFFVVLTGDGIWELRALKGIRKKIPMHTYVVLSETFSSL